MLFHFNQVVPDFLEKEKIARSAVWGEVFSIKKGERWQLVAPSGSGKTSLVHFIYGLRNDYSGQLLYNKENIAAYSAEQMAAYRSNELSVVFQDLRLFSQHSCYDNIAVKRQLNAFHASDKISEMAERLGVTGKLKQAAGKCSYGEQQRMAIIRALQQPFDFILLDEPFSHLDEKNAAIALELILEEASQRNAGIILADLSVVKYFPADQTIQL